MDGRTAERTVLTALREALFDTPCFQRMFFTRLFRGAADNKQGTDAAHPSPVCIKTEAIFCKTAIFYFFSRRKIAPTAIARAAGTRTVCMG